jgi:putative metalloprotease
MGITASAQFGKKVNLGKALQAGKDVVSAVTLSDADIAHEQGVYGMDGCS